MDNLAYAVSQAEKFADEAIWGAVLLRLMDLTPDHCVQTQRALARAMEIYSQEALNDAKA